MSSAQVRKTGWETKRLADVATLQRGLDGPVAFWCNPNLPILAGPEKSREGYDCTIQVVPLCRELHGTQFGGS